MSLGLNWCHDLWVFPIWLALFFCVHIIGGILCKINSYGFLSLKGFAIFTHLCAMTYSWGLWYIVLPYIFRHMILPIYAMKLMLKFIFVLQLESMIWILKKLHVTYLDFCCLQHCQCQWCYCQRIETPCLEMWVLKLVKFQWQCEQQWRLQMGIDFVEMLWTPKLANPHEFNGDVVNGSKLANVHGLCGDVVSTKTWRSWTTLCYSDGL